MQFFAGWFGNPIFVNGKYPDIMRQKIDFKSAAQGFTESRLPHFTKGELYDSFVRKRAFVIYQSESEVIKVML